MPENHAGARHLRRGRDRRRLRDIRRAAGRLHGFGETEVQDLHGTVRPDLDVRGLQIAMDDAVLVRGLKRLGDLCGDGQRLVERDRAARDALERSSPRYELHHKRVDAVRLLQP